MPPTRRNPTGGASIPFGVGNLHTSAGGHIGHFYETEEQCLSVVSGFLRAGLLNGDKCVFLAGSTEAERALMDALSSDGCDAVAKMESGQLDVREGFASPAQAQAFLRQLLAQVPDEFPLLRWVGDMTWATAKLPCSRQLMEWESHCNLVEDPQAVFLCQYDVKQFSGSVVMDALRTHPLCIVGEAIHRNPMYVEPETFLAELRAREASA